MCKVISVANIKGGVAKTTTAANLGVGLVNKGKKVLLIDADPQGSLSLGLGVRNNKELPYTLTTTIQKVINEIEIPEGEGIVHNEEGVDILPSNNSLRIVEQQLDDVMSKEHILEEYIERKSSLMEGSTSSETPSTQNLTFARFVRFARIARSGTA